LLPICLAIKRKPTERNFVLAHKKEFTISKTPYEKLQELEQQFVTDITPLVDKQGIKAN
jgi:hypothetical protein